MDFRREIWRKSVHLAGLPFLPVIFWNSSLVLFLLLVFLGGYLWVEMMDRRKKSIPFLSAFTWKCKRPEESGRFAWGPALMVGAAIPLVLFLEPRAASLGLLQVFLSDAVSTLVGLKWGAKKIPWSPTKSWLGSAAFFISAFLGSLFFIAWPQALILASAGTLIESLPFRDWDNLLVPLGVGILAALL